MSGATGRHLGSAFKVVETQHDLKLDVIRGLCLPNGELPAIAHIARNVVSSETTHRFADNFWRALEKHGSYRLDDGFVQVSQIGATQFGHSSLDYLEKCVASRSAVDSLFEGISIEDRSRILGYEWLVPALEPLGYRIEPAKYNGLQVSECTARSWRDDGAFLLQPHEDKAQLLRARRDGFEIGSAMSVLAWVCCIDVDQGGELIFWDIAPDHETRLAYDLEETGYPYPAAAVNPFSKLEISFRPGDVILFRADFVHAVSPTVGSRISAGRFLGALDDRLIYWT